MGSVKAPFLTYEDVSAKADAFSATYNAKSMIPVAIEAITEFELNLEIRPMRGLMASAEVDGFLSFDFRTVFVDEDILCRSPSRYRFTLAHEVGHFVLHKETFASLDIIIPEDWIEFYLTLDEFDQGWFERQAYWFAGAVLVPEVRLLEEVDRIMERMHGTGIDPVSLTYHSRSTLAGAIAKRFLVSTGVIERRLRETGIW